MSETEMTSENNLSKAETSMSTDRLNALKNEEAAIRVRRNLAATKKRNAPQEEPKAFCVQDSGSRQEFIGGSVRDTQEGKGRYDLISPIALHRLSMVCQQGAQKYGDRNWEKGQPLSRFMDSAKRHLNDYLLGYRDEDHLSQAVWNIMALVHTEEIILQGGLPAFLADLPDYTTVPEEVPF
jgi:hypothetical protein